MHPDKMVALQAIISMFFVLLVGLNILVWSVPKSIPTWILRAIVTGPTIYILVKIIVFFVRYL
jgi:hypothetical protein